MKIGLVSGEFPPMQGGVGAFTQALAKALAGLGHEIHIFTSRQARPAAAARSLRALRRPVDIGYASLHPRGRRWWWGDMAFIVEGVRRYDLDVLNIQYQPAAYNMRIPAINLLPWRLKRLTTTVVTFHDLRLPYLFPKAGRLRQALVNLMARQAGGVIVTNVDDYEALRLEIGDGKLRRIPIGSNIEPRTPDVAEVAAARRELGLSAECCLLGYFGFLNESKGADTLIRALGELDEHVHLVFIGGRTGASDPTNRAFQMQVERLISELNLAGRVHWTGFVDEARVSAYFGASDLMVMPYRDGASLRRGTLMAALAHGRPLLTTKPARLAPELVHGKNIWLAPPGDPPVLAAAIRRLLSDPALRKRLSEGAAEAGDCFTWDKIAAQTAGFFEALRGD